VQVTFFSFSILYPLTVLHHSVSLSLFPRVVVYIGHVCKCVQDEKLLSHDNLSFSSTAAVYPFLSPSSPLSPASKTNHMCMCVCVCVCVLPQSFFFILLQVRFFILFRSRTRHNIKRTRFSYRRRTTIYVRFLASYSMRTTSATPGVTLLFPTFFLYTILFFRAAACCIYNNNKKNDYRVAVRNCCRTRDRGRNIIFILHLRSEHVAHTEFY